MSRTYTRQDDKITLAFPYNAELVAAIKEIEYKERKFDPISKEWKVNLNHDTKSQLSWIIKEFEFIKITDADENPTNKTNVDSYIRSKSRLNRLKSYAVWIDEIVSEIKPYAYQRDGINRMCNWDRMINGDDMGIGKTIQTIYTAEVMETFPTLLICPSSTKYQWKDLWLIVNPKRKIYIVDSGDKCVDWKSDVVIINYDLLGDKEIVEKNGEDIAIVNPKFKELIDTAWEYVVLDEIHYCKNSKSIRGKMAKMITKDVDRVHGLTGTLIENKPLELVHPLMIIGIFDEVFGGWQAFTERYCNARDTRYGRDVSGASNTIELNRLLRETCYIRREKRDVLKDLPDIQHSILDCKLSNKKTYIKAENEFIEYMKENYDKIRVDSAMMAQWLVQRNQLRQLSLKGKTKEMIEWLFEFADQSDEKVLIVGNFKEPLYAIMDKLKCKVIDGSTNAEEKRNIIKAWSKNDEQFLCGNIKAIGTGTDGLQDNCSTLVVIDLPEKPSTLDQLISRLERIGQKNFINIYYLLSRETIDIKMWDAIQIKRKITEAANKGLDVRPVDINDLIMKSYLKRI